MQKTRSFIKNIFNVGKQQHKNQLTLKQLRESQGLTQQQLAKILGIRYGSTVCNYERGRRTPDLITIHKIADVFNVSFEDVGNIFLHYKVAERK